MAPTEHAHISAAAPAGVHVQNAAVDQGGLARGVQAHLPPCTFTTILQTGG